MGHSCALLGTRGFQCKGLRHQELNLLPRPSQTWVLLPPPSIAKRVTAEDFSCCSLPNVISHVREVLTSTTRKYTQSKSLMQGGCGFGIAGFNTSDAKLMRQENPPEVKRMPGKQEAQLMSTRKARTPLQQNYLIIESVFTHPPCKPLCLCGCQSL